MSSSALGIERNDTRTPNGSIGSRPIRSWATSSTDPAEWQLSDSLALLSTGTIDFDLGGFSRGSVGVEINHTPQFSTFVEYRYVQAGESKILSLGANYEISDTYVIAVLPQYDFSAEKFQSVRADITRAFPDFDLSIFIDYDQIRGETRFGASLGEVNF